VVLNIDYLCHVLDMVGQPLSTVKILGYLVGSSVVLNAAVGLLVLWG
jgi:hypothetical protein